MEPFSHSSAVNSKLRARTTRGFTLIELLVVFAIIGIVSAIVISSQGSFNRTLTLSNTAYDVALTVRSAETYGLSSQSTSISPNAGYGVEFNTATPTSFIFFTDTFPSAGGSGACHPYNHDPADQPGNCTYDAKDGEMIATYTLGNTISFDKICAYDTSSSHCATVGKGSAMRADVIFARPNPTPYMSINGSYNKALPIDRVCLSVTSSSGNHRYIDILSSGEITANATSCPA